MALSVFSLLATDRNTKTLPFRAEEIQADHEMHSQIICNTITLSTQDALLMAFFLLLFIWLFFFFFFFFLKTGVFYVHTAVSVA